jgi:hypothetical protein
LCDPAQVDRAIRHGSGADDGDGDGMARASARPREDSVPLLLLLSTAARAGLVEDYDVVRLALAEDRTDAARAAAVALAERAPADVAFAARAVAHAEDVRAARLAFGELSRATVLAVAPTDPDVKVFRCPMADGWPFWLQLEAGIANPYMGTAMPRCGYGTSLRAAARAAVRP